MWLSDVFVPVTGQAHKKQKNGAARPESRLCSRDVKRKERSRSFGVCHPLCSAVATFETARAIAGNAQFLPFSSCIEV